MLNGLQAAKQLKMANCRAKVIFLTIYEGPDFLEAAFSAGASGYVTKARLSIDLIPALHEVMLGHTFVSGSLGITRLSNTETGPLGETHSTARRQSLPN